jgi:hypothetical protein
MVVFQVTNSMKLYLEVMHATSVIELSMVLALTKCIDLKKYLNFG